VLTVDAGATAALGSLPVRDEPPPS
jgi:hypothetical protein